jgi:hypothetical protein
LRRAALAHLRRAVAHLVVAVAHRGHRLTSGEPTAFALSSI